MGTRHFSPSWTSRAAQRPTPPPTHCILWVLSTGVKQTGHQVQHSLPCSDKVKNEWGYTSSPHIRLLAIQKYFIFSYHISSYQCLFYSRICKSWHTSLKHWFTEYMQVKLYMWATKLFIYLLMIISNPGGMYSGCLISTDTEQELATRFPLQISNLTKMTSHSDIWLPRIQFL